MPTYTYEQLKEMTVAQLREIAKDIKDDALEGHTTMHKDHLLPILCKVLGIHIHHAAAGAQKARMKITINKLKKARDTAIAAHEYAKLAEVRRHIHTLKHKLRRMALRGG